MHKAVTQELPPVLQKNNYQRSYSESCISSRQKTITEKGYFNVSQAYCRRKSFSSKNQNSSDEETPLLFPEKIPVTKLIRNKSDVLVLCSMALITYIGMCAFSMIAPFFPKLGKEKGASESMVGIIFAVYPLCMFFCSPVVGKIGPYTKFVWQIIPISSQKKCLYALLPTVGPKFILIAGCFIEGVSEILFAFVSELESGTTFVIYCFAIRIVTAVGSACTMTAFITILSITFKEHASTIFGLLELFTGLGLMTGPALGGVLYKYGGFKLPFISLGVTVLVAISVVAFILPSDADTNQEFESSTETEDEETGEIFKTLFIPGIAVIIMVVINGGMLLSFLDPTLADHVSSLDPSLSTEYVGLVFLIAPSLYTFLAPLIGYLIDKKVSPRLAICVGLFGCAVAYQLIGPAPIWHIKGHLYLTCFALVLLGCVIVPTFVPALADMKRTAKNHGLPDNLATQSILSGIFNAAFSIGAVIGPTLGGALTEWCSFDWASMIFSFYSLALAIFVVLFTMWERRRLYRREQNALHITTPVMG